MKVLFSDFDDTLYFHNGTGLREKDVRAIKEFQKDGGLFVISTGRPVWMKADVLRMIDGRFQPDYMIFSNGSLILDENDQPVYEVMLDPKVVEDILSSYPDDHFFLHSTEPKFHTGEVKITGRELLEKANGDFTGIYSLSFDPKGNELVDFCNSKAGVVAHTNSVFCDVLSDQAGKGKAISIFKEKVLKSDAHTGAIGDSYNDIEMIRDAQIGFTFNNSPKEVKEQADYIVDGIWQAIEILKRS